MRQFMVFTCLLGAAACNAAPTVVPELGGDAITSPPQTTPPSTNANITSNAGADIKPVHFRPLPITAAGQPGLCLDVAGTLPGARVQVASCSGLPNQAWVLHDGQLTVYESLCLDLPAGTTPETAPYAVVNNCNSTVGTQIWADYNNTLRIVGSVQCLTLTAAPTDSGMAVSLAGCQDGDASDQWILGNADTFNLTSFADPNQCLGTTDNATANGSQLSMTRCDAGVGQGWSFHANHFTLGNACLDAPNLQDGARLQISACSNVATQNWFWQTALRMGTNNKCVDLSNALGVVNDCDSSDGQRFYVTGAP